MYITILVTISVIILTLGIGCKILSSILNKQKIINRLQKEISEKQNYYKDKTVINELMSREEYVIKNNKILFSENSINIIDTKNSSRIHSIDFNKILEVKKEYLGNVYQQFVGDKIWDGYALVIVYSDSNRILNKRVCLKENSNTMYDIVDSVTINTLSNIIIDKIYKKIKK